MFDNVSFNIDRNKDIVTIRGIFGNSFIRLLEKKILSKDRLRQIFITYGLTEISFYGFFALEVRTILNAYLNLPYRKDSVVIKNTIKSIEDNTWLNNIGKTFEDTFDYNILKEKFVYELLPHQKSWFHEYNSSKKRHNRRGRLLAAAPGTGKGLMALALAELLKSNKILVITPLQALETVWINNVRDELYKTSQVYYSSLDKREYNNERILIYHYESINEIAKVIKYIKGNDTTIIIDESHNMNELTSKRTISLLQICEEINSDNILLLSGSPIKAMPLEMLPMIELLDKGFNPIIKNRFIKLYKNMPNVLKPAIQERYTGYRTFVAKDELKLPEVVTESINIKLPNAKEYTLDNIKIKMKEYTEKRFKELNDKFNIYENTYNELYNKAKVALINGGMKERDFIIYEDSINKIKKAYKDNKLMYIPDLLKYANKFENETIRPVLNPEEKKLFNEAKTIVKYLKLKIQGEVLGSIVGRERINCHMDLAKHIDYKSLVNSTNKKSIIFSNYIDVCEIANKALTKIGYTTTKVYGNDTKYLNEHVSLFMKKDNEVNPLVATYKSLSTAVPLIAANVMIFIDLPFRNYIYEQAVARIHRLGQDEIVFLYQIHLDTGDIPNINSRNIDIIEWSKKMVEELTGYSSDMEIIKNEGTDEGRKTIFMDEFISSFTKDFKISKEEKKETILDSW